MWVRILKRAQVHMFVSLIFFLCLLRTRNSNVLILQKIVLYKIAQILMIASAYNYF